MQIADNNIGCLRYVLALSLIAFHYCVLTDRGQFWPIDGEMVVDGFFILAGFFCLRSYEKAGTAWKYYKKRLLRIFPPYAVAVAVSVLLGLCLTTTDKVDFLTTASTWKYLLVNLLTLNFLQPTLEGVFSTNPTNAVNGALWFVKVLLCLYALTPFVAYLLRRFRPVWVLGGSYVLALVYLYVCQRLYEYSQQELFQILQHQFGGMWLYYVSGMTIYVYFCHLRPHFQWILPIACLLEYLVCSLPYLSFLIPIVSAMMLISLVFVGGRKDIINPAIDISYELFLFHCPIIQMMIAMGWLGNTYGGFFLVILITFLVASAVHLILSSSLRH